MSKGINHIGIAVRSLSGKRELYEGLLGGTYDGEELVPEQGVRVAFFLFGPKDAGVRIELLEPTGQESPVHKFIEKRGEGIHHIAFSTSNVEERIKELKSAGLQMIDESPRNGAHNTRIAFVHPKSTSGVLVEVCEPAAARPPKGAAP